MSVVDFDALRALITAGSSGMHDARVDLVRAIEELDWWKLNKSQATAPTSVDPLLTYKESAEFLKASESYVGLLVRQGKLRAITLPATDSGRDEARQREGRSKRVPLSALKALTEEG